MADAADDARPHPARALAPAAARRPARAGRAGRRSVPSPRAPGRPRPRAAWSWQRLGRGPRRRRGGRGDPAAQRPPRGRGVRRPPRRGSAGSRALSRSSPARSRACSCAVRVPRRCVRASGALGWGIGRARAARRRGHRPRAPRTDPQRDPHPDRARPAGDRAGPTSRSCSRRCREPPGAPTPGSSVRGAAEPRRAGGRASSRDRRSRPPSTRRGADVADRDRARAAGGAAGAGAREAERAAEGPVAGGRRRPRPPPTSRPTSPRPWSPPAPARERRRPGRRSASPAAWVLRRSLPTVAPALAWGVGRRAAGLPEPGTDLARLTALALVLAGPATSVGAVMALAWWPRLVGVVVAGGLAASVFIGRSLSRLN